MFAKHILWFSLDIHCKPNPGSFHVSWTLLHYLQLLWIHIIIRIDHSVMIITVCVSVFMWGGGLIGDIIITWRGRGDMIITCRLGRGEGQLLLIIKIIWVSIIYHGISGYCRMTIYHKQRVEKPPPLQSHFLKKIFSWRFLILFKWSWRGFMQKRQASSKEISSIFQNWKKYNILLLVTQIQDTVVSGA